MARPPRISLTLTAGVAVQCVVQAGQASGWRVVVVADLIVESPGVQAAMERFLEALCRRNGTGPLRLRIRKKPRGMMIAGWADSVRLAMRSRKKALDGVFLCRADLLYKQAVPIHDCVWGPQHSIQLPWIDRAGKKYCDTFAFISAPALVADALEELQLALPALTSLHTLHKCVREGGVRVGVIFRAYKGTTLGRNPFVDLVRGGASGRIY